MDEQIKTLTARINLLQNALAVSIDELLMLSTYRTDAHEYDRDMGHDERYFGDEEDWDIMEKIAKEAAVKSFEKLRENK